MCVYLLLSTDGLKFIRLNFKITVFSNHEHTASFPRRTLTGTEFAETLQCFVYGVYVWCAVVIVVCKCDHGWTLLGGWGKW